ncbi:MAG: CRISPR-associated endonuclease Cas3'', partial [Lentisphaeria bacterium]|nr:CRISPR-associated endonuclease Cas3'' [Lentisphaeria bacterium]
MIYAHSLEGRPESEWQTLSEHSRNVSILAEAFAGAFHSEKWAKVLGLLHDGGKSRSSFQDYLKRCNQMETGASGYGEHSHSGAGACWCRENLKEGLQAAGRILSYCIAGHHAGLPDWIGGTTPNGALMYRLQQERDVLRETQVTDYFKQFDPQEWKNELLPPWKFHGKGDTDVSFWIRMLFSCLTDADCLDAEAFSEHEKSKARTQWEDLAQISKRFFEELDRVQSGSPDTPVNRIRSEIRKDCELASLQPPGIFSLTVPTGGGKTLSGTAFAFRHALKYGKKRIIYVIPYTSIIEQTVDVLRRFAGENSVLEHHSNFAPEKETLVSQLASENWDAPMIVTTSVQFFESLYASSPGKCRKLHNIAESVVILDEVQLLPKHLL